MARKQYRVCWFRPGTANHFKTFGHQDAMSKLVERLLRNDPDTTIRIDMREVPEWSEWDKSEQLVALYRTGLSKQSG